MASYNGDCCFDSGDGVEAVSGVLGDVLQVVAVGAQSGSDGGLEARGLCVAAGRQAAVGEHQRDQLSSVHQNIA
ncbi:hypothetical protein [Kribbella jejuensis]|uniref:hypothetical protein n=1 Tax=Kribbella jejuensis TaxID=236068 RepID=UPI001EE36351|nr:hypothetical protein [Kribbella jejuensis]